MDGSYISQVLWGGFLVAFFVFLNGFFVAAEFAIVKVRDTQLAPLAGRGNRRAKIARIIVKNLDASLSATQLGITLASLGLGWFAEPIFAHLLEPVLARAGVESADLKHKISMVVGLSVITFLHVVAGELAPKSLAIQRPLPTTIWAAAPLMWFYRLSYPFIWTLNHTANWLLRRFGIHPVSESELVHSEEELRLIFAATQEHAGGSALGRLIVLNALDLRQRIARDVMRPRHEIEVLDTAASMDECLAVAEKTRYSRFPLCEDGDIDRCIGVVHLKDLYGQRNRAASGADLKPFARRLVYVPETSRLETVLRLLLDRKVHMAIVVDEFGGTVGMVTLENILEELVGQIQDEFDQEKPLLARVDEHTWLVDGALPLHELGELVDEPLQEEGITTTSGFVTRRLGGFPKPGDIVRLGSASLRVEKMAGPRVASLKVVLAPREDTTFIRKA